MQAAAAHLADDDVLAGDARAGRGDPVGVQLVIGAVAHGQATRSDTASSKYGFKAEPQG